MRLDKLLANMGYGSRKEIKKLCKNGAVKVDGKPVKDSSVHVDPDAQEVEIFGEVVHYREFVYLMMNKPQGVISATEDAVEETVVDLLAPEFFAFDVFPVGRLDKDTEGLLLLTNDGKLAHELLSPKKHVPKRYFAQVEGRVTEEDREAFRKGVTLDDGYKTLPAELTILTQGSVSEIELIIYEGKYHQVKRMFEAVGKKVTYLKRLAMGGLELDDDLEPGEYRELAEEELELLRSAEQSVEK
ncbi:MULTISPECIES: pseudouridine synthase [Aneurinibacillus]|jgi:16S rRNA pseudouridine516 synthase|uniref:Pseudouridine synthase n=1 Tax=Aneurinibacillus danicus TaxID=267746 RepID=A0A511VBL2_9BACL|nr:MULTISPECIES: pseudouridine synthase [Aneurinibacillus]GEN34943.1 pseudouridine synthase [Aneurinibacillus danicus]